MITWPAEEILGKDARAGDYISWAPTREGRVVSIHHRPFRERRNRILTFEIEVGANTIRTVRLSSKMKMKRRRWEVYDFLWGLGL